MAKEIPRKVTMKDSSGDDVDVATEAGQDAIIDDNEISFEDTNFVTGDSPVVLDINASAGLGRNATKGFVVNDGPGNFTIALSNNGTVWGDEITLKSGEAYEIERRSVDSIRITWVADSAYRVVVI